MKTSENFDVIIIGGSYAGLSAAMALGRSLRNVLVLDSGLPCNRQTPHSHNFLTNDGKTPAAIAAAAKAEVLKYETIQYMNDVAIEGRQITQGFSITTQGGKQYEAKKLIFATGIKDIMPDIRGFEECWGISVVHCPYCHGFELQGKKTGIMANGPKAFHLASLVNNLTDDITIFSRGEAAFNAEELAKMKEHNIAVVETEIASIEHEHGYLSRIHLTDGSSFAADALYAGIPFTQHSDIPAALGCAFSEHGYISVDAFQHTTVKGVYACGDNAAMMRSVANAVYTGNLTGAMVNKELTDEAF